jgi:nucleoside-diphosphate-sugar epimerase
MTIEKNTKIVLPGGAGLVGQNLVATLKGRGYTNLVVLDKHPTNVEILKRIHPLVQVHLVDLAEKGDWESHFENADAVVMLQAQIGDREIEPFIRNNITATENILTAIKKHAVEYTVHISSSVVNSVAKDHYTETKKQQESIVVSSGINCVVLRPTLMFGWFDRKHLGWLSRFMKRVPVFPIPGNGRYMRQPLYAADFANIIANCLEQRISRQSFNITGLEKVDYVDIIREIKIATGSSALLLHIPYLLFYWLLLIWAVFDRKPPFTADQLRALVAHDEFEIIDWPTIFSVKATPFKMAISETFNDPSYGKIVLEF